MSGIERLSAVPGAPSGLGTLTPAGLAVQSSASNALLSTYNLGPDQLRLFRAKFAASQQPGSTTICTINCVGDSETSGVGLTTKSAQTWPVRLGVIAGNRGRKMYSQRAGFVLASSSDDRITDASLGGFNFCAVLRGSIPAEAITMVTGTTAGGATAETCDGFDIRYFNNSSIASFSYSVDGAAATTINIAGTANPAVGYTTHVSAGSLGSHSIVLKPVSGDAYIHSIVPTVGSSGLQMFNFGLGSSTTATWTQVTNYTQIGSTFQSVTSPALTLLYLNVNDWLNQLGVTTFTTNTQTLITNIKAAGGDAVLVTTAPPATPAGHTPPMDAYTSAMYSLADLNNIGMIEIGKRWKDYATSNPLGFYSDTLHPSIQGHQDIAELMANALGL